MINIENFLQIFNLILIDLTGSHDNINYICQFLELSLINLKILIPKLKDYIDYI